MRKTINSRENKKLCGKGNVNGFYMTHLSIQFSEP